MKDDIKEIAKEVRGQLKAEFPQCDFSVTVRHTRDLTVALMRAPFNPVDLTYHDYLTDYTAAHGHAYKAYEQLNPYQLHGEYWPERPYCNGVPLTREGWELFTRVTQIANARNWDRSDIQTDYFNYNYALSVNIGKWDKPFEVTPMESTPQAAPAVA